MRAVDTNLPVRLVARDDARQAAAADAFVAHGAWVSHIVLVETIWVLTSVYKRSAESIGTALGMLLQHGQLTIQDADVVEAAVEHFRRRPAVGFSECMILEGARKAGHLPLGTFGRDLAKLPETQRLQT